MKDLGRWILVGLLMIVAFDLVMSGFYYADHWTGHISPLRSLLIINLFAFGLGLGVFSIWMGVETSKAQS